MRYLLDTQLVIWAKISPHLLPDGARGIIGGDHDLAFSVASLWEAVIKTALGRPNFNIDARQLRGQLLADGFTELGIAAAHVLAVADLPPHHGDPFDRLMLAQAKVEGMRLLTTDRQLARYGSPVESV